MGRHHLESSEPPWYRVPPGDGPRRRRRRWPVAAFVAVLLTVGGWFGWAWLHGTTLEQSANASSTCPAGNESLQIAATPAMAAVVSRIASDYARTNPVVMQHCVTVAVSSADPKTVLNGLTSGWNEDMLGPKPDAWIADSTLWTNQLPANSIGDPPLSLATSPIVLAMPEDAAKAVNSAGAPAFAALPGVVSQTAGWSTFKETAWGQFTVALPDPSANAATALALEAMIDPATPQGQPSLSSALNSTDVQQELATLAGSQPAPPATSSHEALVSLGGADGIQHAPFSAVPVAEVDLYERNLGIDGDVKPPNVLDEVRLSAGTPYLDYPYTPLAGSWVTSDIVAAAESFRNFMLTAAEQTQLSRSGFRVSASYERPDPSPGMDWGVVTQAQVATDPASFRQLVPAWQAAGQQH